jgi:hypothetical protein
LSASSGEPQRFGYISKGFSMLLLRRCTQKTLLVAQEPV